MTVIFNYYYILLLMSVEYLGVTSAATDLKIIGGIDTAEGEFPFMISLQMEPSFGNIYHYCSGVIYSSTLVYTAAHCVYGRILSQVKVVAGAHNLTDPNEPALQRRSIVNVQYHPDFEPNSLYFDSAAINLDQPLEFNLRVQPMPLTKPIESDSSLNCTVIGWGSNLLNPKTSDDDTEQILQKLNVTTMPLLECQLSYQHVKPIDSSVICAAHLGTKPGGPCTGDAGAPLICNVENQTSVSGILSWSMMPCADGSYPPVFTRIENFYNVSQEV